MTPDTTCLFTVTHDRSVRLSRGYKTCDDNVLACSAKNICSGVSLVVQGLRRHTSSRGDLGSIPGQGTKIPQAIHHSQKILKIINTFFKYRKISFTSNVVKILI